jgi:uncharacterized cupin superfamily protein
MPKPPYPIAIVADEAPPRTRQSIYPEPFASRMAGRRKHPLGDLFGLANFGVNLTRLAPGGASALRHAAGTGNGHRLVNETAQEVVYLEMGDRTPGDEGTYPDDDIKALLVDGQWKFTRKDGSPF